MDQSLCPDDIWTTLDKLGLPRDSKWRALIMFMRSIKDYQVYTSGQKHKVQQLVMGALQEGVLSEEKFQDLARQNQEVLSEPWRKKLQESLNDVARTVREARAMMLRRKGDLQFLETSTLQSLRSGRSLLDIVEDIRRGFQEVISLLAEDADNLVRLSLTDQLTGLANRRAFEDRLVQAAHGPAQGGKVLCLILADVDHFATFNERFGQFIGDQALAAVGSVLKALRGQYLEQDQDLFAARYGGGEFAVLTQAISRPQAMDLAEVIRGRVQGYNFVIRDPDGSIATTGIKVTVSLGVACQTAKLKKASGETLLRAAQDALAEAKLAGRNRVELG